MVNLEYIGHKNEKFRWFCHDCKKHLNEKEHIHHVCPGRMEKSMENMESIVKCEKCGFGYWERGKKEIDEDPILWISVVCKVCGHIKWQPCSKDKDNPVVIGRVINSEVKNDGGRVESSVQNSNREFFRHIYQKWDLLFYLSNLTLPEDYETIYRNVSIPHSTITKYLQNLKELKFLEITKAKGKRNRAKNLVLLNEKGSKIMELAKEIIKTRNRK